MRARLTPPDAGFGACVPPTAMPSYTVEQKF